MLANPQAENWEKPGEKSASPSPESGAEKGGEEEDN
jgi:hypothetical protein